MLAVKKQRGVNAYNQLVVFGFVQSVTLDHEMAPPVFSMGLLPQVKFSGSTFRHTGVYLLGNSTCSHVDSDKEPSFKAINIFWRILFSYKYKQTYF